MTQGSWSYLNPVFWKTLGWGLSISILAKFTINLWIPPWPDNPQISLLSDRMFPFPPKLIALTHAEHRFDGWPDYTDGVFGTIAANLGGWIEKYVQYDNTELWVWTAIIVMWFLLLSLHTVRRNPGDMLFSHIGLGLMVAALFSNQGEVAIFGHATDFIFVRFREDSSRYIVTNLADLMVLLGLLCLLVISPIYERLKRRHR